MYKFIYPSASTKAFTLIELIITVAIAATLIVSTVTSFRSYTRNNITLQFSRQLLSDINFARNYALTTKKTVSICPSADVASGTSAMTCTNADLQNWQYGWIIYTGGATDDNPIVRTNTIKTQQQVMNTGNTPFWTVSVRPLARRVTFSDRGLPTITTGALLTSTSTVALSATPVTIFSIKPVGCSGNNAREIKIDQTGSITLVATAC